jgi:hypothetical protein
MLQDGIRKSRRGVKIYESNPFAAVLDLTETSPRAGFVRLYPRGVVALRGLSGAGTKVFELLCLQLLKSSSRGQVKIRFGLVDQATSPMSKSTYSRGLSELVEHGFLAATLEQGLFWFNAGFVRKFWSRDSA